MRKNLPGALSVLMILSGCAGGDAVGRAPDAPSRTLTQLARSPIFLASPQPSTSTNTATAADAAARFARGVSPSDRGVRKVEAVAAPILYGSPEGRAFLASPRPRAFVIGAPPATCPARIAATGSTMSGAAETALGACFSTLAASGGGAVADCGCLVVALGDLILVPPDALSYAPGVSARISAPDLGLERYLVSEEITGDDGGRVLTFRAAGADSDDAMVAAVAPDGGARVLWRHDGEDVTFAGRRIADGLRRGRYAERLYVEDAAGRRMTLLIGYEPVEYAVRRRELLAWPRG